MYIDRLLSKNELEKKRSEWECAQSTLTDIKQLGGSAVGVVLRYRGDTRRESTKRVHLE
jgi:hypothetical protein